MTRLPINLFIRQRSLAFKQDNQYLKHNHKKGVVSLIRNTLVSLNPERVVTLNRNQVVTFSEISTLTNDPAQLKQLQPVLFRPVVN